MKRRSLLRSIAALPAASKLAVAQSEAAPLALTTGDSVARPATRFFSDSQRATLLRLAREIVPPFNGRPGATEASIPEFLEFLISQSPAADRKLYRDGLDALTRNFDLTPLSSPWLYRGPADGTARFLTRLKDDLLRATINSREYAESLQGRSRGAAGIGTYWLPIE